MWEAKGRQRPAGQCERSGEVGVLLERLQEAPRPPRPRSPRATRGARCWLNEGPACGDAHWALSTGPPAGTKPPNPRPGDPAAAAVTADRCHAPPSSSAAGGSEDLEGARPSSESLAPGGLSPCAESGCGNDQGGGQSGALGRPPGVGVGWGAHPAERPRRGSLPMFSEETHVETVILRCCGAQSPPNQKTNKIPGAAGAVPGFQVKPRPAGDRNGARGVTRSESPQGRSRLRFIQGKSREAIRTFCPSSSPSPAVLKPLS